MRHGRTFQFVPGLRICHLAVRSMWFQVSRIHSKAGGDTAAAETLESTT
jgi:hypothetical protein